MFTAQIRAILNPNILDLEKTKNSEKVNQFHLNSYSLDSGM